MTLLPGWLNQRGAEIIAGTPPGGGQDRVARALSAALEPPLRAGVVNLPGRGGANGWERLAGSADPNLLAVSSPTLVTNSLLGFSEVDERDLTSIALLCTEYVVWAVPWDSPIPGPERLLELLGSHAPPTTALATARGNVNHFALGQVGARAGADPAALPVRVFESARYAVADLLAGSAEVATVSAASVIPELQERSLRVLAVSSPDRLGPPLESVPTWEELGVSSSTGTWRGVVAAPHLTEEQRRFWEESIVTAQKQPAWAEALQRNLWASTPLDGAGTDRFLAEQRDLMASALMQLGLTDG